MTPGYKTSELWATVGTVVSTLLTAGVVAGFITPVDAKTLTDAVGAAITAGAAFATNAYVIVQYISHRTALKAAEKAIEKQNT